TRRTRPENTPPAKTGGGPKPPSACSKAISPPPARPPKSFPPFPPRTRAMRGELSSNAGRGGESAPRRAPVPAHLRDGAPFSAEQRVWLNGLFAGLLSLERGITPLSLDQAAALLPGALDLAAPATPASENDDGAPWHDPAMPLADRMKLAEGRPLRRRM